MSFPLSILPADQPVCPGPEEEDVSVRWLPAQGGGGMPFRRGVQAEGPEEGGE